MTRLSVQAALAGASALLLVTVCIGWLCKPARFALDDAPRAVAGASLFASSSVVPRQSAPVAQERAPNVQRARKGNLQAHADVAAEPQRRSFFDRFRLALGRYDLEGEPVLEVDPNAPAPAPAAEPPKPRSRVVLAPAKPKLPPQPDAANKFSLPGFEARTAVYDIAAHAVYLPNGRKLEAHSGFGHRLDNPRYVNVKNLGPTPPNVYALELRGQLFHGVRAIRLKPVDEGKMYGRDGILAHTYMLGSNGQSNGCVSFRDYPAFLNAFLKGEIDRLVVVDRMATARASKASDRSS